MYYELPYIDYISADVKHKFTKIYKFYCKNLERKMILAPFKSGDTFMKDPIPKSLKSFMVYKFVFLGRNTCHIAEEFILRSICKWIKVTHFCTSY